MVSYFFELTPDSISI